MMKKNIIYSLVFMLTVAVLTACGTDNKKNPPPPPSPYSFYNATTPIIITDNATGTSCSTGTCPNANTTADANKTTGTEISVQLLKNGLVEPGEQIEMKPFDRKYGFVTDSFVITDLNGKATFVYNPPENFSAIRGQDITIEAIYAPIGDNNTSSGSKNILLTQEFVLQFR